MNKELDAIEEFCNDIRSILANADYSDEDGISDTLRDVRIRLENIEGKVADIRGRDPSQDTEPPTRMPVYAVGNVVRYRGVLCRVEAVINRSESNGGRPWYWYDLREQDGDGEYLDVAESAIVRQKDAVAKNNKPKPKTSIQRFFLIRDPAGSADDIWINTFRIEYLDGREVKMSDGRVFGLDDDMLERLLKIIGIHGQGEE